MFTIVITKQALSMNRYSLKIRLFSLTHTMTLAQQRPQLKLVYTIYF